MHTITLKKGDIIFREHEMGDAMYRVLDGSVKIIARFETKEAQELTELTEGAYFGEMSLLEAWLRSATAVVASESASLEKITVKELNGYFSERSERIMDIMRHLSGRLRDLTADYRDACATLAEMKPDEPQRSDGLRAKIRRFAAVFFAGREEAEALKTTGQPAAPHEQDGETPETEQISVEGALSDGDILFREGDEANCMYELRKGQVAIYSGYGTPGQKRLTLLFPKSFFGEMGLIDHAPRSATAVAVKKGTRVETIREEDLARIFRENPEKIHDILRRLVLRLRQLTANYLEACRLIAVLEQADRETVAVSDREKAEHMAQAWRRGVSGAAEDTAVLDYGIPL